jgi:hypothetical protein
MLKLLLYVLLSASSTFRAPNHVTVAIIGENCGNDYISWRKANSDFITSTRVENNIMVHTMYKGELVFIMSPKQSEDWFKAYSSKIIHKQKNKVLFFGEESIYMRYDQDFVDLIKEKLGSEARLIIPDTNVQNSCNYNIEIDEFGC